ncbi:HPP family protein [Maridesulfovibrio sp.]|uniref:HPP family protein n=1 Tax=Maridesulfovibrio sp. TaxID=2795000 RepID=UPI0029F582BD|nr:HPP family protein [Maridesulfovibrio sp.]
MNYFDKMKGGGQCPPRTCLSEILWSWIGAFCGILPVAILNYNIFAGTDLVFIIGSFGASAVLIYGAITSPLAQPRNLIGGHIMSALIGVACYKMFPDQLCLAAPLAVATAIAVMHATNTLHPPGGASALIAVIGSPKLHALGYWYAVVPVGLSALIMLVVAVLVNNMAKARRYPVFWY